MWWVGAVESLGTADLRLTLAAHSLEEKQNTKFQPTLEAWKMAAQGTAKRVAERPNKTLPFCSVPRLFTSGASLSAAVERASLLSQLWFRNSIQWRHWISLLCHLAFVPPLKHQRISPEATPRPVRLMRRQLCQVLEGVGDDLRFECSSHRCFSEGAGFMIIISVLLFGML